MSVAIVNCGISNLASIRRALEDLGAQVVVAQEPSALRAAKCVVLPGVGAFPAAMEKLTSGGWIEVLRELCVIECRPLLGICLGMQLLSMGSDEGTPTEGLGFIDGRVRRLDAIGCRERIPHVGCIGLAFNDDEPLFAHIPQGSDFYFVHSFAFDSVDSETVVGRTDYGVPVVAAVRRAHVFGTQFHPEKSSRAGRQLLRNFLDFARC